VGYSKRYRLSHHCVCSIQSSNAFELYTRSHSKTYACPRTWEFLDRLINGKKIVRENMLPRVAGTIGAAAGYDFLTFCEVQKDIPDWADLLDPKMNARISVPTEASAKFATICWASNKVTKGEVVKILPFIQRFGADFQVIFCRGVITRFKKHRP